MMVLSELRGTYHGADSMYRVFERAEIKLGEQQTQQITSSIAEQPAGQDVSANGNQVPMTPESSSPSTQLHSVETAQGFQTCPTYDGIIWGSFDLGHFMDSNQLLGNGDDAQQGVNELLSLEEFNNQYLFTEHP